jgi:ubiquinone biosynthesis accessory factor UbiK
MKTGENNMLNNKIIDEIASKISQMLASSPAADIEKNLNALLRGIFTKLELVTREEFDIQTQVLQRTREQLDALEKRLAEIEAQQKQ